MSQHEDEGMMNTLLVTGTEGATVNAAARLVDSTCYTAVADQGYVLL